MVAYLCVVFQHNCSAVAQIGTVNLVLERENHIDTATATEFDLKRHRKRREKDISTLEEREKRGVEPKLVQFFRNSQILFFCVQEGVVYNIPQVLTCNI